MGFGLEGRVPFLDHTLVELALSIPPQLKVHKGDLKRILKQSVRGLIPDRIIDRPKQGWILPTAIFKERSFADFVSSELQTMCQETDLFDFCELNAFLARESSHTWAFLSFALWWKHTVKSQPRCSL
jgi:asparagine synthase (glutamine-hydrolysing)